MCQIEKLKREIFHIFTTYPVKTRRNAQLSATCKYWKRTALLNFLYNLRETKGLDITPTLAINCINEWVGRGVSWTILLELFGTPGRTAAIKTTVSVNEVVEIYRDGALLAWNTAYEEYKNAVSLVWHGYKPPSNASSRPIKCVLGFQDRRNQDWDRTGHSRE
jgi:hypothetical protein